MSVRSFFVGLLGVIAVLSAVMGSIASWLARHLVDRQGFEALTSPLAHDPQIKDELTSMAADETANRFVEGLPLLEAFRGRIRDGIKSALDGIAAREDFVGAGEKTLASMHEAAFSPDHTLSLNLQPMAQLVTDGVTRPFGANIPIDQPIVQSFGAPSLFGVNAFALIQQISDLWAVFVVVAVVSGILSVLCARRRPLALTLLGVGIALGGGAGWLVGQGVPETFAAMLPAGLGSVILRKLGEQAAPVIQSEALWLVYIGAVLVVLAIGVGLSAKEKRRSYVTL